MTTRDIQMISLDILKDVHKFCVENNIKYSLYAGSLIGAVRHKGFIPWDDDLDIVFTRPEYDKFVRTYKSEKGFKLFSRERQGDNVYLAYARVCDMERTYVDDKYYPWIKDKKGVWIDILPLDGADADYAMAKAQCDQIYNVWMTSKRIRSSMRTFSECQSLMQILKSVVFKIGWGWRSRDIWDRHIDLCKQIPFEKSEYYNYLCWVGCRMRGYYKTTAFSDYILKKFEDAEFYVMKDYDGVLRTMYGDYMQLPPEKDRKPIHSANKFYWLE